MPHDFTAALADLGTTGRAILKPTYTAQALAELGRVGAAVLKGSKP
jgi:hypothetical protein